MEPIRIERYRSTHQHGRVTLTAELSAWPTAPWRRICLTHFARYREGFGEQPDLLASTIVVPTTPRTLATSQLALEAVVTATNQACADGLNG